MFPRAVEGVGSQCHGVMYSMTFDLGIYLGNCMQLLCICITFRHPLAIFYFQVIKAFDDVDFKLLEKVMKPDYFFIVEQQCVNVKAIIKLIVPIAIAVR